MAIRATHDVDVVVVGGGHNGLVAAAYLARAGLRVRLLERQDHVGGAAVSAYAFPGVQARLSRYSYLVSLLPSRIVDDLGAGSDWPVGAIRPTRRIPPLRPDRFADGAPLHIRRRSARRATRRVSPNSIGESGWSQKRCGPRMIEPLPTRSQARAGFSAAVTPKPRPPGQRSSIDPSVTRSEAPPTTIWSAVWSPPTPDRNVRRYDDPSLRQNICFLYHLLGGGTG